MVDLAVELVERRFPVVGGTGIEPATSSVSGKRSPAELTARDKASQDYRLGAWQTKCSD
jgi:hypothetical protein